MLEISIDSSKIKHILKDYDSLKLSKLPDYFDKDLAYVVRCKFADGFVNSVVNFDENGKILNSLKGADYPLFSKYLLNKNFYLRSEFEHFISQLQESGIMEYWTQTMIRIVFPKQVITDEFVEAFAPNAVHFPFIALLFSLSIALVIFTVELCHHAYVTWKLSLVLT